MDLFISKNLKQDSQEIYGSQTFNIEDSKFLFFFYLMRKIENHKTTFLENPIKVSFVSYFFSFKITSKIPKYLNSGLFSLHICIYR